MAPVRAMAVDDEQIAGEGGGGGAGQPAMWHRLAAGEEVDRRVKISGGGIGQAEAGAVARRDSIDAGASGVGAEGGAGPIGGEPDAAPLVIFQAAIPLAEPPAEGGAGGRRQDAAVHVAERKDATVGTGDPSFGGVFGGVDVSAAGSDGHHPIGEADDGEAAAHEGKHEDAAARAR